MKKATIIAGLALSVSVLAAAQSAHAEDTYTNKTTSGNVNIVGGETEIIPDPPKPYPPSGPYQPVGEIGIASATNLYFDDIELGSDTTTRSALYLNNSGVTETPITNVLKDGAFQNTIPTDTKEVYVPGYSVADRRGTGAGWSLSLQLGEFIQTDAVSGETPYVLRGATLKFPTVTPITVETSNPEASEVPTTNTVTFKAGGDAAVLMNANKGQGKGLWEARYNSRELTYSDGTTSEVAPIELTVPGDNYKGTYKADLVWNLADAPTTVAP